MSARDITAPSDRPSWFNSIVNSAWIDNWESATYLCPVCNKSNNEKNDRCVNIHCRAPFRVTLVLTYNNAKWFRELDVFKLTKYTRPSTLAFKPLAALSDL